MLRERKPLGGYRHRLGSGGTQTIDQLKQRYLSLLPDLPHWVETRDLLSCEGSVVAENATRSGFVIWSEVDGLGSVVGEPNPEGVVRAADCVSEILAFPENVEQVRTILHDFRAESATVFSAPAQLPPSPPHPCRRIGHVEIASLQHLQTELMDGLSDVAQDGGQSLRPSTVRCQSPLPMSRRRRKPSGMYRSTPSRAIVVEVTL